MRNTLFLGVIGLALVFWSCEKDMSEKNAQTGKMQISFGALINIHELGDGMKSVPEVDDFKVLVYRADGSLEMSFQRVFEMPDTIELVVGDYYVEAFSDNNLPTAFDNPYYHGETPVFTISSNMHQSVQVNCTLSNTPVSVVYSDNIVSSFLDYSTTVSSEFGSLIFSKTETRMGYLQTAPFDIAVDLSYQKPDGTEMNRTLTGSIPSPMPNRHYQISVDASIMEGMSSFQILLDTTEVLVEVVEISDQQDVLPGGPISYGDILISEIMCDPSALSDTEGEWFELYNNADQAINLQNLILGRDDINMHTITDSIVLLPGDFYVFARTTQATNASNSYIYGSAITLSNSGAVLNIFNEEVDGSPGEIIYSVNYGGTGFPSGSGESISLNPLLMTAANAIHGSSWCISTSSYNTGDLGTPGVGNDNCQ